MENQLQKLELYHDEDDANDSDHKHQQGDQNESMVNATVEPKSITNICYNCLERIFDFLDVKSLSMVAQTCKRLHIAAFAYLGEKFGEKKIFLQPNGKENQIIVGQEEVKIAGIKRCSVFLRCFGAKILNLSALYHHLRQDGEDYLDYYIVQYCADTLISLNLFGKSRFSGKYFKKPLKNVQKLEITRCHLENQLKILVDRFPNLRHLKMSSVDETASTNVCFPHLEHLRLHISNDQFKFRIEDAADLLLANPQLQSLEIWSGLDLSLTTILDTISTNALLTKLDVSLIFRPSVIVTTVELTRFLMEHSLVEELLLRELCLTAEDAINFIGQMKSLKRIIFQVNNHLDCDRLSKYCLDNKWKLEKPIDYELYVELNRC